MSKDDIIQDPQPLSKQLIQRAQKHSSKLLKPSSKQLSTALALAEEHLSPHLQQMAEWLLQDHHVEGLQSALSKVANTAISLGFHVDPAAALLFEFSSWLEEDYGRQEVLPRIMANAHIDDGVLIRLLTRSITDNPDASPDTQDPDVLHVRQQMLLTLCSLAQLDEETPLPSHDDIHSLYTYLKDAVLPHQFDLLPDLVMGYPEAFEQLQQEQIKKREKEAQQSRRAKLKNSILNKLNPQESTQPTTSQKSTSLTRSSLRSPALNLLTSSYLLFIHTTITRTVLESFPDMIANLKQAEEDENLKQKQQDAISIEPDKD